MSSIKKHLFNEHEVNEYFCDQLANNWERINKKVIKNEYVFGSAIDYHTKLLRRGISGKSQKYWDLIDRYIYKYHKEELAKYFSMNN